jgi:hypothetical protein
LFPPQILNGIVCKSVIEPQLWAEAAHLEFVNNQNHKDYLLLPCAKDHTVSVKNKEDMQKVHNEIKTVMINAQEHVKTGVAKYLVPDELENRQRNNFENSKTNNPNDEQYTT